MDRRSFLRGATVLGSGMIVGGALAGCSTPGPHSSTAGSGTSTSTSAVGPPNWAKLSESLTGTLLEPGDTGYASAGHLYNAVYVPDAAAIAQCASTSDVQRCLAFARAHGVQVTARSGGHSYGGYSSCPGLVIDVSRLNAISVDGPGGASGQKSVSVGAGSPLIDVYSQLGAQGLLLPGGSCPTVGIAGLALGGGIGVFSRAYGLTCDQTTAVEIVTADGTLHRSTADQDEDLYWASRGGGGGKFGIVTSFGFQAHPIPESITLFTLEWPWAAAGDVLHAWLKWIPSAPDELWANCQLFSSGSVGNGLVKVTGVCTGSVSACTAALVPLTTAISAGTTYRFVGPEDYLTASMIEAGCEGEPVAQCATPSQSPFVAKSSYVGSPLSESAVTAIVSALSSFPSSLPGAGAGVVFDGYGGAINQVGAGETAFVHRNAISCAQYSITYAGTPPTHNAVSAASTWLQDLHNVFEPVTQGSYQNYIDPTLSNWQEAYYGSNLPRLRQVKREYDPDNVFKFAQSIPA
jgi:FAD/FMN-containing dehydrogenase